MVGPEALGTVQGLLHATYHPDHPLARHMGLRSTVDLRDVDRMVERRLTKLLTLVAYDASGRLVGAAVNDSCHVDEVDAMEEEMEGIEEGRFRPILAIHHQLRRQNRHVFQEMGTDKLLDLSMVAVEEAARGQGVATDLIRWADDHTLFLIVHEQVWSSVCKLVNTHFGSSNQWYGITTDLTRRSILLAGCLGYLGVKAEATSTFGKEVYTRVGMLPAHSIDYNTFTYQGERVFDGMTGEDTKMTFMRKKFFQTAIKHIL